MAPVSATVGIVGVGCKCWVMALRASGDSFFLAGRFLSPLGDNLLLGGPTGAE